MRNAVIGIDPGQRTGVAIFAGDREGLSRLSTISPDHIEQMLADEKPALVVFEDSRRQSAVFRRDVSPRAMLKIARNVGEIDNICRSITQACRRMDIDIIAVSPLAKGRKVSATAFAQITGWAGRSNQHERDAAMVAMPYRWRSSKSKDFW